MLRNPLFIIILYGFTLPSADACDVPIVFEEVGLTAKTVLDPVTQEYKIIIDPDAPALISEDGMRFLIAHECAHIKLDHIPEIEKVRKYMTRSELDEKINQLESEADCHAVNVLMEEKDKEAIAAGLEFIAVAQSSLLLTSSYSSFWRISNIKKCVNAAKMHKSQD